MIPRYGRNTSVSNRRLTSYCHVSTQQRGQWIGPNRCSLFRRREGEEGRRVLREGGIFNRADFSLYRIPPPPSLPSNSKSVVELWRFLPFLTRRTTFILLLHFFLFSFIPSSLNLPFPPLSKCPYSLILTWPQHLPLTQSLYPIIINRLQYSHYGNEEPEEDQEGGFVEYCRLDKNKVR